MRYIKKFEKYKVDTNVEQDVRDILVELLDYGFEIDLDFLYDEYLKQNIIITIENKNLFNSNITEDYLIRIMDYFNFNYSIIKSKFAIYKRVPSVTLDGIKTFTTDTTYYDTFPYNININSIGVDIVIKTDDLIKEV